MKVGGIFKPRQPIKKNIKNTNNNKNKFENTEKKFTENKVQAVFQSYKLFEPDSNQPEINDY